MKTYLLDILKRIKRKSEELDAKTVLCNTPWKIFNDDGVEEAIHFRENGTLLVVINGRTTSGTWEIFVEDRSVHIMYDGQKNGIMLKPVFKADGVLAMQLDGTEQYAFLVDKNDKSFNKIKSLTDLNNFYKQIEQKNEQQLLKETEEKKKKEEAERIKREAEILEKERLRKLKEERVKKNEYLNKCLKERAKIYRNDSVFYALNYSVDEMVYEINRIYKEKNFFKYLKLPQIISYDKYFDAYYLGRYYEYEWMENIFGLLLALLLGILLTWLPIYTQILFLLVVTFAWWVFFVWMLIRIVKEMIEAKAITFLKNNKFNYGWYDDLKKIYKLLNNIDGNKIEKDKMIIFRKYKEITLKRYRFIEGYLSDEMSLNKNKKI